MKKIIPFILIFVSLSFLSVNKSLKNNFAFASGLPATVQAFALRQAGDEPSNCKIDTSKLYISFKENGVQKYQQLQYSIGDNRSLFEQDDTTYVEWDWVYVDSLGGFEITYMKKYKGKDPDADSTIMRLGKFQYGAYHPEMGIAYREGINIIWGLTETKYDPMAQMGPSQPDGYFTVTKITWQPKYGVYVVEGCFACTLYSSSGIGQPTVITDGVFRISY